MIDASIVICTYRRPKELAAALEAVARQVHSCSRFQVVVVDNDPDGSASDVLHHFSSLLNDVDYVREPQLGISLARMRGAKAARGEWVVYLDDDCVPEESWLGNLLSGIRALPQPGVIGGAVLPYWSSEPPCWLTPEFHPYLSMCDYAGCSTGFWLDFPTQYPLSANSAYPRELLLKIGGFRPEFGRRGNDLLSGEETDLNCRIKAAGYGIWYCPTAVVHHWVPQARLEKSFFRSRYFSAGRTWALLHLHWFGIGRVRKELGSRLTRGLVFTIPGLIYYGAFVRRNPFLAECLVRESFGYIAQAIQILRNGSPQADAVLQGSQE